jgi:ABC-type amino acid transport substrate-binding protein
MSAAFVLVDRGSHQDNTQDKAELSDFKNVKIGVSMSSPADAFLFDHGYDRSVLPRERQVLKALDAGDVELALVWSPALAYARKDYSNAKIHVVSKYEPEAALRWNMAMAVPEADAKLKQSVDDAIGELLKSGEIKRIVESYGVPFFPPIS